jgi:hypothetical protein
MNALAIGLFAAALAGLGTGYWSGKPGRASPSASPTPAPKLAVAAEDRPVDPAWRPGLLADLDKAETHADFSALMESVYDLEPDRTERDEWVRAIVASWVDQHGKPAVSHLLNHSHWNKHRPDLKKKMQTLREFALHRLATTDVDAALRIKDSHAGWSSDSVSKLILERHPDRLGDFVRRGRFAGSSGEWAKAGATLAKQGDEGRKSMEAWLRAHQVHGANQLGALFAGFADELAKVDAEAMFAWSESIKRIETDRGLRRSTSSLPSDEIGRAAARHLLETDFARAREIAESGNEFLHEPIAIRMAETDITAAAEWLKAQRGGELDYTAASAFHTALNALPFGEAVDFLESYPLRFAASHYVTAQSPAAIAAISEQVATMPDSAIRNVMQEALLNHWSRTDPPRAIRVAREQIAQGADPKLALSLTGVVTQNPEHLFELISFLPPGLHGAFVELVPQRVAYDEAANIAAAIDSNLDAPLAAEVAGALVRQWAEGGLRAPSRWLAELPPGDVRDAGAAALVEQLADHDADAALRWAESISDEQIRTALLETLSP